jgi:Holliday junction resolvasome RuvABC DNA-binding subunit
LANDDIADVLERVADLLEAQDALVYRVRAYRNAARILRTLDRSAADLADEEALETVPGIGKSLAAAIREVATTGRLGLLDRLEGETLPEDLFTTLPGIGDELARRIHEGLGVETLEDLEVAAHDGRLESVPGIGPRRAHAVRDEVAAVLGKAGRRRARRHASRAAPGAAPPARPSVATLLAVDAEYRARAAAGTLRRIAPRRFNPERVAWLPILHAERDGWSFTALFSNTARAHALGATSDWVVLFFERDGEEGSATVVTERSGPLAGLRVVRGRERESAEAQPPVP